METFTEYRQMRELAELSVRHGIDLGPLVELSERLLLDTDLAPEEVYREFLQQAANMVGNLAGKAVRGVGSMVNNFKQGYQQGRGPQQAMPEAQPTGIQGIEHEQPSLQGAFLHLQSLKRNLQGIAQANARSGQTGNAQALQSCTDYLDQISQMIQKVLADRHGIAYDPHTGFTSGR